MKIGESSSSPALSIIPLDNLVVDEAPLQVMPLKQVSSIAQSQSAPVPPPNLANTYFNESNFTGNALPDLNARVKTTYTS